MALPKGVSGNPNGRPVSEKTFANALRLAVHEVDDTTKKRKLRLIAEKLVECAEKGEGWAVQMVADRLDGKAVQPSEITIHDRREPSEFLDEELAAIIASSRSTGTVDAPDSAPKPDRVHEVH